jgi:predicted nucleic acid-binding protein
LPPFSSSLSRDIRTWLRFKVQDATLPVMVGVLQIKQRYDLSYWDAAIIAAA